MPRSLAGTRIRQRRRALGLKQATLAEAAGISASYLNLIEHNRRSAAGKVLSAIARELGLPIDALEDGAEQALVSEVRDAALNAPALGIDAESAEEFVARYQPWATLVAQQARTLRAQAAAMTALNDRINYDPQLQETLHEMLTTITAIRASSSILVGEDEIDRGEAQHFQKAIDAEAGRLSEAAQALVTYFDRAEEQSAAPVTPEEAFDAFIANADHVFPGLEDTKEPEAEIEAIVARAPELRTSEARWRARRRLRQFAADAAAMPLEPFLAAGRDCGFAPDRLAGIFGQPILNVFRRLAVLRRPGVEAPPFGLVIVNASGHPIFRRTLKSFSLPRFTSVCALWPAFQALSTPGRPMEDVLVLPNGAEFFARSIAEPVAPPGFGSRPMIAAGMIVTPITEAISHGMIRRMAAPAPVRVGTSCRLCPRPDCPVRSDPGLVPED